MEEIIQKHIKIQKEKLENLDIIITNEDNNIINVFNII
jgi:hypothetical protein